MATTPGRGRIGGLFLRPLDDIMQAMDGALARSGWRAMPMLFAAMLLSWWAYVPLHELFHAWGCLLAGGSVTRLELDALYGGRWLAEVFPYVHPASDYAGRLSGFDTHGSDTIYLITVFAPYLLTLFIGIPLLYLSIRRHSAVLLGISIPWAATPFISLTGDYYEIGSIVISRIASTWNPDAITLWRSDDLPLLATTLFGSDGTGSAADFLGITLAFALGTLAAFVTYAAGSAIAQRMFRTAMRSQPQT